MYKKYIVRLSEEERGICEGVVQKLKGSSQKARRARILLKADADGPAWPDAKIAEAFNCRVQTIEAIRKRLVTEGFELALEGKKRETPPTPPKLDGKAEAKLIAMRLGKPPAVTDTGRCNCSPTSWWPWRWSIRSATRQSARR